MPPVKTLSRPIGLVTCCNLMDRLHPLFVVVCLSNRPHRFDPGGSLHAVLTRAQATPRNALSLYRNAVDAGSQQLASHSLFQEHLQLPEGCTPCALQSAKHQVCSSGDRSEPSNTLHSRFRLTKPNGLRRKTVLRKQMFVQLVESVTLRGRKGMSCMVHAMMLSCRASALFIAVAMEKVE